MQCNAGQRTIKEGGPSLRSKLRQVGRSAGLTAGLGGSTQPGPKGWRLGRWQAWLQGGAGNGRGGYQHIQ